MKTKFIIATLMLAFTFSAQAVKIESFITKCSKGAVTVDLKIEECPVQVELSWALIPIGKSVPVSMGTIFMEGSKASFTASELPTNEYCLRLIFNGVDIHRIDVSTANSCVAGIPSDD